MCKLPIPMHWKLYDVESKFWFPAFSNNDFHHLMHPALLPFTFIKCYFLMPSVRKIGCSSFTCGLARRLTFLSAPSVFFSLLFGSWHCLARHWCGRERRKNQAQQSSSHEASAFIYKIKLQQQLWKQKLL